MGYIQWFSLTENRHLWQPNFLPRTLSAFSKRGHSSCRTEGQVGEAGHYHGLHSKRGRFLGWLAASFKTEAEYAALLEHRRAAFKATAAGLTSQDGWADDDAASSADQLRPFSRQIERQRFI